MEIKINGVKITERGWAGHFILAHKCTFHRNTLLEKGDVKIVVSSVGRMLPTRRNKDGILDETKLEEISAGRYYETMVFFAEDDKWQDADASRGEIECVIPWCKDPWDEMPANVLHDEIVEKYIEKMANNEEIMTAEEMWHGTRK